MLKKVCIVGAGVSGIVSTKHCIEAGFEPTCYEASDHVCGLWNWENSTAVPNCTVTNTSKEMSCFSDFPMPDDFPNFLHADKFCAYFQSYIANFGLSEYIKTGCEVSKIECCESAHGNCLCESCVKQSGRYWRVLLNDKGSQKEEYFDYVMVANGYNNKPYIPEEVCEVTKRFEGNVMHSTNYRSWEPFENKKVVICGLGNSSGDISCELSRHASQVYLATNHGNLVASRLIYSGYPLDAKFLRRYSELTPIFLKKRIIHILCNSSFNHANFGLEVNKESQMKNSVPLINDEISSRIATGSVVIKPGIMRANGKQIIFKDGSAVDDVDTIILCTGYRREFKFLEGTDMEDVKKSEKILALYKNIFSAKHKGRIAFIGMVGVSGSACPISEMQARYTVEVFKGNLELPPDNVMNSAIKKNLEYWNKVKNSASEVMKVNFISYQDDLAAEIGAKPCIWRLVFQDPILAWHLFFGPSCPYQYRLAGPHVWDGARKAVLTVDQRIFFPLAGKSDNEQQTVTYFIFFLCFVLAVTALTLTLFAF